MTLEELKAAYPGCPDAVEWHESRMCNIVVWPMQRMIGENPHQTLERLKLAYEDCVRMTGGGPEIRKMRPQMDHPDFMKYIKAKLGVV